MTQFEKTKKAIKNLAGHKDVKYIAKVVGCEPSYVNMIASLTGVSLQIKEPDSRKMQMKKIEKEISENQDRPASKIAMIVGCDSALVCAVAKTMKIKLMNEKDAQEHRMGWDNGMNCRSNPTFSGRNFQGKSTTRIREIHKVSSILN